MIGGTIPSELCSTTGFNINVTNTNIHCYSGCLTSAKVIIEGATHICPDGSIMERFGISVGICCVVCIMATMWYKYNRTLISEPLIASEHSVNMHTSNSSNRSNVVMDSSSFSYNKAVLRLVNIISYYNLKIYVLSFFRCKEYLQQFLASKSALVIMSFIKLLLVVIISMIQDNWWTFGHKDKTIVASCSGLAVGHCYSYCPGNVETITATVTDDFIHAKTVVYTTSYCIANLPASCAYKYWLIFKLVPMMAHLLVLLLQCVCLYYYEEFTPQETQFATIMQYLYPIDENSKHPLTFSSMMQKLTTRPLFCIFPFFECATAGYVWIELLYPTTNCNNITPLSSYMQ